MIILNYNDADTTRKLIDEIRNYATIEKIIVVDNCSLDNSFFVLNECSSKKVEVIRLDKNRGYACGNNYGAFYAMEHYNPENIFIANPDISVNEDVIIEIVEVLESSNQYGIVSALVEKGYNVWRVPGFMGTLMSMFLIVHNVDKYFIKKRLSRQKKYAPTGVVEGSFFAIKAEIFKHLGGFDERTFLYYEENILAHKLKKLGLKEVVLTDKTYRHLHAASIAKEYKSKAKAFRNYKKSMEIYLLEYLKIGKIRYFIFGISYKLAYIERCFYDIIKKIKQNR